MASTVFVDDTDNRIVYTDGWFRGGTQNEFGATTHGTRFAGAKATFTFTGTSVAVFGTIANRQTTRLSSMSAYSIDGSDPIPFTASPGRDVQYKQQFFRSPTLPDGTHTLVITSNTASAFFWLDFFQVDVPIFASMSAPGTTSASPAIPPLSTVILTTSAGPPSSTTGPTVTSPPPATPPPSQNTLLTIDDTDNRIIYAGPWFLDGRPEESQATIHGTVDAGATATLTFTGSSISVYGTITENRPGFSVRSSTYSVDGITPSVFTPSPLDGALYQTLFFQSPPLQNGHHTLVVTAGSGDLPLLLDFFQVNSSSSIPTTFLPAPTVMPSGVTTASLGPPSSEPSDNSTDPPSQATSSGPPSRAGAIAGGVLGSLLFLGLVVFIIFRLRRRRKASPPPPFVLTTPDPGWAPGPTWTNEKLTMRHYGGV